MTEALRPNLWPEPRIGSLSGGGRREKAPQGGGAEKGEAEWNEKGCR